MTRRKGPGERYDDRHPHDPWIDGDAAPDTNGSPPDPGSGKKRRGRARRPPGNDGRPIIHLTTDEHQANDEAIAALASDREIYQRGGTLVRVTRDSSPASKSIRRPHTPRIEPVPLPILRERLCLAAQFVKARGEETVCAHPPAWCVSAVACRGSYPGTRHLEAVVDHPILRPDGTIAGESGYDETTGLMIEPNLDLPNLGRVSRRDALVARDALLEVVEDFPFQAPAHRSTWLAALLTPLARFSFSGPAPLFLADANAPGSGKGLLLDVIARILTGDRFTVCTYTTDQDELRKRITSLAVAGDRLVLFDNLSGAFGNATLDAVLTASSWEDRILGSNRMARAPLYVTWFATGNNVSVHADTARRICHARLESSCEKPEERSDFHHPNLLAWVKDNRRDLLTAALLILAGYSADGGPDLGLSPWGSFDGWSRLIRSAVVWLDLPDPAETRIILQEQSDVDAQGMRALLSSWYMLDPDHRGMTAGDVIQRAREGSSPEMSDLRAAIEMVAGRLDSRALGFRLRSYRRRIFGGLYIDRVAIDHKVIRWGVFQATSFTEGTA